MFLPCLWTEMILKIDYTADQFIYRVKQRENDFKLKLLNIKMDCMQIETISLDQPFRNPKLIGISARQLLKLENRKISDLHASFEVFTEIKDDLRHCTFNITSYAVKDEFGYLKLEKEMNVLKEEEEDDDSFVNNWDDNSDIPDDYTSHYNYYKNDDWTRVTDPFGFSD